MEKLIIYFLLYSFLLSGCKKDNVDKRACNSSTDGSISAVVDNQSWSACEFKSVYYPKLELLSIVAVDETSNLEIRFYITIDTITPLKSYNINFNSNNGIEIVQPITLASGYSWDLYICDPQKTGIGGIFTLTSLDTLTGKISASFSVTGFSKYQNRNISITNGVLNNVKLTTQNIQYDDPSFVKVNMNGVNWYSKQVNAGINLNIGGVASFLRISVQGYQKDIGYCQSYLPSFDGGSGRELNFQIPLSLGTGTYPLKPWHLFHQTLSSQHFLFYFKNYNDYNDSNFYYPITGSNISVTSIDNTNRNLDATYTTQTKDSLGNNFNFTSGEIHIRNWEPL